MFVYNANDNRLDEIAETTYSEEGLMERDHIEEWIRKKPEILGEELLIVGHEYDKFDTDERLDLLAIDKEGALVVIELKRDRSGSSVDFQSLKYCSYCSRLSPQDIIGIYQDYISKFKLTVDPVESLASFLDLDTRNEDKLNEILNRSQKFTVVGREIDRRILSVCAWLTENGIACKCVTLTPYKKGDQIFVDPNIVIPPFSVSDFYVGKKERLSDERIIFQSDAIVGFFKDVSDQLQKQTSFKVNYNPRKSYCTIRTGGKIQFAIIYSKKDESITLEALTKDKELKPRLNSFFQKFQQTLETEVGLPVVLRSEGDRNLDWCRLEARIEKSKKAEVPHEVNSVVEYCKKYSSFITENW